MGELTEQGIVALKAGDRVKAHRLLSQAVNDQPDDAQAWLWLSGAVTEDEERIACLQQVLRISPANQAASRGLEKLHSRVQPKDQESSETTLEEPQTELSTPTLDLQVEEPHDQLSETITPSEAPDHPGGANSNILENTIAEHIVPRRKDHTSFEEGSTPQRIFRTRPSMVPALACFWLFFFGTILLAGLVGSTSKNIILSVVGVGVILEIVVLFVILRNFRSTYELTNRSLNMRIHGKKSSISLSDILHVEPRRTSFQKTRGTADLLIDSIVSGELVHLRLRDIPEFQRRIDQIREYALITD
jgi:hypothetical protein